MNGICAFSTFMSCEAIRVAVRLRPLVAHERGQVPCLAINSSEVSVIPTAVPDGAKEGPWRFDHAMDSSITSSPHCVDNAQVYDLFGRGIVEHALEGFNTCLFCYGQTGTGKTTTILGDKQSGPGLLILLLKELFKQKSERESKGSSVNITVQMLEVYNEKVFDLLCGGQEHGSRPNVELHVLPTGVQIKGAKLNSVDSVEECLRLINQGNKLKHTAATAMNSQSSRGHTVFKLVIQQAQHDDGVSLSSEIYFADLAGHENEKTTKVTGERLLELSCINKSLMWLQSAMHALATGRGTPRATPRGATRSKGSTGTAETKTLRRQGTAETNHMTLFRNSKLTLLLSNALLGNSLVHVIVTLSPAAAHFATSLSSLKFANEVKHIMVDVHSSVQVDSAVQIRNLEAEVQQLKDQLAEANLRSAFTAPAVATTLADSFSAENDDTGANRGCTTAADRCLEEKLQICETENEELRREVRSLRTNMLECRACVKDLYSELDKVDELCKGLQDNDCLDAAYGS